MCTHLVWNKSMSEKVQAAWTFMINECKYKLSKTLLDDLFSKYSQVKQQIDTDFQQLDAILAGSQLQKIKQSLQTRCSKLAPTYTIKAKCLYERAQAPKGQQPKRRKVTPEQGKNRNQDELQRFMFQLKNF